MPLPDWYELGEFAAFLLRPSTNQNEVTKASLSLELEQRAASATTGLGAMSIKFAAFGMAKAVSLDAWPRMSWKGDGKLTLVTDSAFYAAQLARNLEAEAWSWDEERDGSVGSKRKHVEKCYFAVCDEVPSLAASSSTPTPSTSGQSRTKPRAPRLTDKTSISFSLETNVLTVRTPVCKWSKGFRHVATSAALPTCTLEGPAKLCPKTRTWVPRTHSDHTPAAVAAQYDRSPWQWWG